MTKKRFPQIIHCWMYGDVEFAKAVKSVRETGAEGVDIGITLKNRHNSPEALLKQDVAGILAGENLKAMCTTPMHMFPELDFSHSDPAMRQAALDFGRRCLEVTRHAGSTRMTIPPSWVSVKHEIHVSYDEDRKRSMETVAILAEDAKKLGITLLVEPINRFRAALVHTIAEAKRYIRDIGADNLGICADTYHITLEEAQSAAATLLTGEGMIHCLHIGENNRKPPGYGALDWKSILWSLRAIDFKGPLSFEPVFLYYSENKVATDPEYYKYFHTMMTNGVTLLNLLMDEME